MRVATLNIRNGDADDGALSWVHRERGLIQLLADLDTDIIGLQEVLSMQLPPIVHALPDHDWIGAGRIDGDKEGEFTPIFYRRGMYDRLDHGWFWLSEIPEQPGSRSWGAACERMCTWALLESESTRVMVVNTHLDHVSALERENGTALILSRFEMFNGPKILMGDFNALPDETTIQNVVQAGWNDSLGLDSSDTFHNFGKCTGGRIDYIFGSGLAFVHSRIVSTSTECGYASDHHGVEATIQFSSRDGLD
ncbi:MAG: endonuclease/exonuclease/phosphatase family protein [Fimbriimonadaceae bacterium]|nr:endonuclease/exonuclease/phosphatase family protein [Fimbriimonadaceae bacterium]